GCVRATCLDACQLGYEVTLVQDAHSNYHPQAAQIIDEWHRRLSEQGVSILPTQDVQFAHTPRE
ncbi:MAG: isochorismatase family protein, partial [Chloroflexi bacterium]|nr:isochorismatase family protein [Chloroflexota bacterium]